jgi:hypothetical protein
MKAEAVITVKMLLMLGENIARNMYSSQGTINCLTQLHVFGHFCKNRTMMDGSMNVKFFFVALRPNAGHGLLILDVSRIHITTHHSR